MNTFAANMRTTHAQNKIVIAAVTGAERLTSRDRTARVKTFRFRADMIISATPSGKPGKKIFTFKTMQQRSPAFGKVEIAGQLPTPCMMALPPPP